MISNCAKFVADAAFFSSSEDPPLVSHSYNLDYNIGARTIYIRDSSGNIIFSHSFEEGLVPQPCQSCTALNDNVAFIVVFGAHSEVYTTVYKHGVLYPLKLGRDDVSYLCNGAISDDGNVVVGCVSSSDGFDNNYANYYKLTEDGEIEEAGWDYISTGAYEEYFAGVPSYVRSAFCSTGRKIFANYIKCQEGA